jgi:hypothetical protein
MDMATMYPVGATVKVVKDIEQGRDSLGIYIIPKGERGIVIHSGPCEWGDPVVIVVLEHLYESLAPDNTMHFPFSDDYDPFSDIQITGHTTGSIESLEEGNFTLTEVTALLSQAGVAAAPGA